MLQSMRERMQGIIAIVIVALVSLTFVLWGIQNYLQSHGGNDTVAKVNGVKITNAQFQNMYERTRQQLMMQMGKGFVIDQQAQSKLKQKVLQQLIQEEAIFQNATKNGFRVNDAQINAVVTRLPVFQSGGHFSLARFQQMLNAMLYTEGEFVNDIQRTMVTDQLRSGIVNSAFILPSEITNIVKLTQQQRDIGYAIIPVSKFMKSVTVTGAQVQQYYQQQQDQFKTPEKVSVAYITLSADQLQNKVNVTDQEVKQYYEDNMDLYSHPARWYVARLFVPIATGADSSAIKTAKQQIEAMAAKVKTGTSFLSLDTNYGKPAWLLQTELPQNFVNQLNQLKPGKISAPFQTQQGFYVVKLLQYKPANVEAFNTVKTRAKEALLRQKTTQMFDDENDKLSNLTYTDSGSLKTAAKQLGLTIQTTDLFTSDGGKGDLLSNPKIIKAAFSDMVLQQNYNSNPIEIGPDKVIVLRINKHIPASVQPLAQVKSSITEKLKQQVAEQKAQELGQQLLNEVAQGKSAVKLAKQNNLTWKTKSKINIKDKSLSKQLLVVAFNMPLPQEGKPSVTGAPVDNGFAIVQVSKVYPGDIKKLNKRQVQHAERSLEIAKGQIDYAIYANDVVTKANVKKFALTQDAD